MVSSSYGMMNEFFRRANEQLTNQVFLMMYGNFEAFLTEMIMDALTEQGSENALDEAVTLMMSSRWDGKFSKISQRLGVSLGKHSRAQKFQEFTMGFFGDTCNDPVDLLQKMADLRHRFVHSTGRADEQLLEEYPNSGLTEGQFIVLPFGFPFKIHLFYTHFTDYIDRLFSQKFEWKRIRVAPGQLLRKHT